ncbi:MAG: corrinoid protein [Candidatus Sumerlaeota bacterium]|nr:corrinoid protein [Candidatus Sumerlaeota bacterium]
MADFQAIADALVAGKIEKDSKYPPKLAGKPGVKERVQEALDEGAAPGEILAKGLIAGMEVVGKRFRDCEIFLPDVLMSAKAMHAAMDILRPRLSEGDTAGRGTIIIGTVEGDLHDIGKNLVAMMMEGAGMKVVDLGVDVSPAKFIQAARENPGAMVGMSALLTTTMPSMGKTISALKEAGLPNMTVIGGAPTTQEFADEIGATIYAPDPTTAIEKIKAKIAA